MTTLGEVGTDHSDAGYTGDTGDSAFSMQYYRNKAAEFQNVMNAMDSAAQSARAVLAVGVDDESAQRLQDLLDEFDSRKFIFRTTAEAINAGAAVVNSMGGRFQELSIPTGLGFLPAIPLAAIAAIATAATLIVWGRDWISKLQLENVLDKVTDPEKRSVIAAAVAQSLAAAQTANDSPLSSVATIAKWGAIALLAFLGYRAYLSISKSE